MEHTAPDGQSYYDTNKTTRQVVREKPVEPLAPTEKGEPSHVDKEYSDNGRNRGTGASTWTIPEESKVAGEAQAATPGAPVGGEGFFPSRSIWRCLSKLDSLTCNRMMVPL
jgi:hypothetical protein